MNINYRLIVFEDSKYEYKIIFVINFPDKKTDYLLVNYSKNGSFNEEFIKVAFDYENNNYNYWVSFNLNYYTTKYTNNTQEFGFSETEIPDEDLYILQNHLVPELNKFLDLDNESQDFFSVKDELMLKLDDEGIFQSDIFDLPIVIHERLIRSYGSFS